MLVVVLVGLTAHTTVQATKSLTDLTAESIRQNEEAFAISSSMAFEDSLYPLIPYQYKPMTDEQLVKFYWDFQNGVVTMDDFLTLHEKIVTP